MSKKSSKNRTTSSISIDERLFSVFEMLHKQQGDTWNDVIARMCDCKDYMGFLNVCVVVDTVDTKRCNKTIDWVDDCIDEGGVER